TFLECEPGWEKHGGNCYYFNTNKSSWTDSRRSCTDLGSDLVKIDSREEQMKLRGLMMNQTEKFWIGLTDSKEEGEWFWVNGSSLDESLSFWSEDQPGSKHGGNKTKDKDCVTMRKKRKDDLNNWFGRSCDETNRSICEKAA
uniref:C-type lectin domain-containing protein n=1 Tax=Poecilia formosa TaxID=48698 RepID=A0A096M6U6_POEFO